MYYFVAVALAIFWYNHSSTPDTPSRNDYTPSSYNSYYDSSTEEDYSYVPEQENPYDDGTGHYAGYNWAEENDVDSCDGNSDSFIEGCEEYVSQKEEAQEAEYPQDEYSREEY